MNPFPNERKRAGGVLLASEGPLPDTLGRDQPELEIQHLAAFPRLNPNPVLELSAAAEIIYSNDAAGEMARALGCENPAQMLPPDTAAMVRECLASGKPKLRVEMQSGPRVISWSFFPAKSHHTVHGYAGDVTARKQAEAEIAFKTTLLEAQSETTLDGILVIDRHGKITLSNSRFQQLWSIPADLLASRDDEKLLAYVLDQLQSPEGFLEGVRRLYAHPEEKSQDEIQFKDGRVLERYSAPFVLRTGENAGRIWYFRDITPQKRAHESLCQSQERLRLALEAANMGVWEWNIQTGGVFWSRECYRILGRDNFGGAFSSFTNLVHPEDLPRLMQALDEALANRSTFASQFRVRRPDGQVPWLASVGRAYYDRGGKSLRMIGTVQDITGRKHAEESMWLLSSAVEQSSESIMIAEAAPDPLDAKIVFVNPAFGRMRGYAAEEILGKTPRMFVRPASDPDFLSRLRQSLARGEVFRGQSAGYRKDGSQIELEWTVGPIHDDSGSITHWVASQRDISENKRAQKALRESEERYRRLVEDSPDTIFIGCEDKIVYINPAGLRLLGARTPDQVVGQPVLNFIHPDYRQLVAGRIATGGPAPRAEEQYLRLDGSAVEVEVTAIPLTWEGKPGAQVIAHDITARKRGETSLRESEERFRAMSASAHDAIIMMDDAGRISFWNAAAQGIFGYGESEAIGKELHDLLAPAPYLPTHRQGFERWRQTGEGAIVGKTSELTALRRDGQELSIELSLSAVKVSGRWSAVGIVRDVTGRKAVEFALAERARATALAAEVGSSLTRGTSLCDMLHSCAAALVRHLDAAFARVWTLNEQTNVLELQASAGMYTHLDGPHGRVPVGALKIGRIAQERKPHMTNQVLGDPWVGEQEWAQREGMISFAGYPLVVGDRVVGVMALFARHSLSDATVQAMAGIADAIALGIDRMRSDADRRSAHAQLEHLLTHSPAVVYRLKVQGESFAPVSVSPNMTRVLGFALKETLSHEWWLGQLHPEDRARARASISETLAKGATCTVYRLRHKNGDYLWLEDNRRLLCDASGQKSELIGVWVDVTERKEAEAKLAALHRELLETSRQAGMAEVATSILHNVGNVLNSVNITSSLVIEKVRNSRVSNLTKAAALLNSHRDDLAWFLASDPKGQRLPGYLSGLAAHLAQEQTEILEDLSSLQDHIEHIKQIVVMQQDYARVVGVQEQVAIDQLVEDALQLNAAALDRHQVHVVREYAPCPPVQTEKHKVLQILVNLIRNAKYALDEGGGAEKRLVVRAQATEDRLRISIQDNGVGIPAENLVRIFQFGFTTRKQGHGFGLHNGALAARQLGGALTAQSAGPGQGALFVLELPLLTNKGPS